MGSPRRLEEKFQFLLGEMANLKDLRNRIAKRREGMERWLKKVEGKEIEVDEIEKEFNELRRRNFILTNMDGSKPKLNKKMSECLKTLESLKEEGIAGFKSIHVLLKELAADKPQSFSPAELQRCTSGLSIKVGFGAFGDVYKGELPDDGRQVAVKVLLEKDIVKEIFMAEVSTMGKATHRNVVKLLGFCFYDDMKALVYEYMENGSLEKVLYYNNHNMKWEKLYNIAIDVANGLNYLHKGCDDQIIHHDVKSANVLLDKTFSPKIADFGLAKHMGRDVTHATLTRTRGTPGYAAPEMWMIDSEVTNKCDVYSFGMMLFEILGRRSNGHGKDWFPKYVWKKFEKGVLDELLHECGISGKDRENAIILSKVAFWCVQFFANTRPSMSTVVKMLEKEIKVDDPPNPFLQTVSSDSSMLSTRDLIPEVYLKVDERLPKERFGDRLKNSSPEDIASTSTDPLKSTPVDPKVSKYNINLGKKRESELMLESYEKKCPPQGENAVIFYTTKMGGFRKTFDDCNDVRRILQSQHIMMFERDLWTEWHADYKQELKNLLGSVQLPAVFVKGRFIGGANEIKRIHEEGRLEVLLYGISKK